MTEVMEDGALLPRLSRVRNMTHLVAAQIVEAAQRAGLCAQVCARVGGAGEVSVCVTHGHVPVCCPLHLGAMFIVLTTDFRVRLRTHHPAMSKVHLFLFVPSSCLRHT